MKILITGGAGFIGHNLALYLKSRGYNVLVYDNLENATERALLKLREADIPIVRGDVRDPDGIGPLIERSDVIVHAAAYVSVDESFLKPREYIDVNTGGTAIVAKLAWEHDKTLIYISSAAVYGEPVKTPISEDHPLNPISPYGLSKYMGERVVELYGRMGLNYVIVRPFNVYGPGQSNAYAGVITIFITKACRGESLPVYGDGLQIRDFVHVDDISQLIELVIEKTPQGEVFNAGSGIPTRIIDLARTIRDIINPHIDIIHLPPRRGDIRESWADISKAHRILGYSPRVDLYTGLKRLVNEICR